MIPEEDIERIVDQLNKGIDRDLIKQNLHAEGLNDEKIDEMMAIADNEHLNQIISGENAAAPSTSWNKIIGYGMMFLGLGVSVGTYFLSESIYVIWYGPVLAGFGFFVKNRRSNKEDARTYFGESPYNKWRRG